MKDSYKVKQLEEMLAYEKAQPENEKYGADTENPSILMKAHWNF